MSSESAPGTERDQWERSYGLRLFLAMALGTLISAVMQTVGIALWFLLVGSALAYLAAWCVVVLPYLRQHPRPPAG